MVHIFLSYISEHGEKGGLMGKDFLVNSIVHYKCKCIYLAVGRDHAYDTQQDIR